MLKPSLLVNANVTVTRVGLNDDGESVLHEWPSCELQAVDTRREDKIFMGSVLHDRLSLSLSLSHTHTHTHTLTVSLSLSLTHIHTVSLSHTGNEPNPPLKLKVDEVAVLVIGRPSDKVTVCVCVCVCVCWVRGFITLIMFHPLTSSPFLHPDPREYCVNTIHASEPSSVCVCVCVCVRESKCVFSASMLS